MNKLKQNRAASFLVVTLVYIIATVVGILTYRALTLDWWLSLLKSSLFGAWQEAKLTKRIKTANVIDRYFFIAFPFLKILIFKIPYVRTEYIHQFPLKKL